MSKISKKSKEKQFKSIGNHQQFLKRITKSLYYGKLPSTECLSLPVTELASELFSEAQTGRSLDRLHCNDAAKISRNACVSPCSFVLAVLYLEQLKSCNPEYLYRIAPSELFLISLMVSSKFLHDDGEEDEVFIEEWAQSARISAKELAHLEMDFLAAIDWKVFVHEHAFWKKLAEIESMIAKRQGTTRGWYTYYELEKFMTMNVSHLLQSITVTLSVLIATYALGILTILGSVFIVSNIPGNCLRSRTVYMQSENYDSRILDDNNNNNTHIILNSFPSDLTEYTRPKHIDAVDILKTSILLATLTSETDSKNHTEQVPISINPPANVTKHSWAWWLSPTMDWLTRTSRIIEKFDFIPEIKSFTYDSYIDSSFATSKILVLENQIHKQTKVRIQDQLERSWHKEWTDTFRNVILQYKLLSVCQ